MIKRRVALIICALVLFAVFTVPALVTRMRFEANSKVYVAAVDLTRVAKFFDTDELDEILEKYKAAGATTAVIHEDRGVYREELLDIAKAAGVTIAIIPDATSSRDGDIDRIVREYGVKYIVLQNQTLKGGPQVEGKSAPVCEVVDKYDLTLVLSENYMQLGNEEPLDFESYLAAADGKILRAYRSYNLTNVDRMDYPAVYYQTYISACDRNTRFINIKQLEDDGFSAYENAERTAKNLHLLVKKLDSEGYVSEGTVNYNEYTKYESRIPVISAAAAAIAVLMLALALDLLFGRSFTVIGLCAAACAFGVTFLMPKLILGFYPTLLAMFAPSFSVTVAAIYVQKQKAHQNVAVLMISAAALSIAVLLFFALIVATTLGGTEYFLNLRVFYGVKTSLIAPMITALALFVASVYKKRSLEQYKLLVTDVIKKTRWYHIALLVLVGIAAVIYIIRSGNVNTIPFIEVTTRNTLTEIFTARPRTKEILVGWPCFVLYIYFVKKNSSVLLRLITAIGASTLFASIINTFCHVFTMVETMLLRVAVGMLFGIPIALVALGVWVIIEKAFARLTAK